MTEGWGAQGCRNGMSTMASPLFSTARKCSQLVVWKGKYLSWLTPKAPSSQCGMQNAPFCKELPW